ncbi:mechanosensitive ion channel family protein [Salinimonas lutimaris]|uniref:mechanosensitive ion channel family protein n=1 Tax=Salinimonas lutimaris TaxID=914153 RepID=UPI0010C0B8BF|nr:mechanosensitive ion channel family protein [Salinimonas lutimaris]
MEFPQIDEAYTLINEKLQVWLEQGIKHLPNIVVALVIAVVFGLLAKVIGSTLQRVLRRAFESKQIADLLTAIAKAFITCAGIFIALDFVGLQGAVTSLLAGAGIIGLAVGFAFQDLTENFIAGIAMGIRKPFEIGDIIEADGVFGTVEAINLRNTLIETFYGQLEIVPNKILFRNILTNYTVQGYRRVEIPVGISYADDPEKARQVIVEAINSRDYVIDKDNTDVYAESFGDSSINLLVWFCMKYPGEPNYMIVRHDAIVTIQRALADNDILIPFPIRTLDFGIKGGEKLDAMMSSKQSRTDSEKSREVKPASSKGADSPEQGESAGDE